MKLAVRKSRLLGDILIPASKSHTIRAVAIASMATGCSLLQNPLTSADALSCVTACRALGADIRTGKEWTVYGFGGVPTIPAGPVDIGNSGTSLRILTAAAALSNHPVTFDGDNSIRQRPMQPLLGALQDLGVQISSRGGKCPITVQGPIRGGKTKVNGIDSQFVSALLLACPLASGESGIIVENLHERPYVQMTMNWLREQNIRLEHRGLEYFKIPGGQCYNAFEKQIPGDFSSATFSLCAAAVTGSEITIRGLDFSDSQGDKEIFKHLEKMGVEIRHSPGSVKVKGGVLKGMEIDLNSTPDALPAVSAAACMAHGETRLLNVAQARLKECDRIKAVVSELSKMGADIRELDDGLIIKSSTLRGASVHGYGDHRMVMALAVAGLAAQGETVVDTAEAVGVTYPGFVQDMQALGADMRLISD